MGGTALGVLCALRDGGLTVFSREMLKQTLLLIAMFTVVRLGNRSLEQAQLGLSRPGRLARRIGSYHGLEFTARRFAALHYRVRFGLTGWQAPVAVHDAVSVLEEVVGCCAESRRTTLDGALSSLVAQRSMSDDLVSEIREIYVQRNRIRGAGHGVGEMDVAHVYALLDRVSVAIERVLHGYAPEGWPRNTYLHTWRLVLNWRDVA